MLSIFCVVTFALAAVSGLPDQRILGGVETTIDKHPYGAVILSSANGVQYVQACGAAIINNRALLSAARCYYPVISIWRARVGSSFANSGGNVHDISEVFINPSYDHIGGNNDLAILHISTVFSYGANVQPARIGGAGYILGDNTAVTVIGWGETEYGGPPSEQLRSVDVWTVNQETCKRNYNIISITVEPNMMCAGYLGVGGLDSCLLDTGGPLVHDGDIIVGIASMGTGCGYADYPRIYARISPHVDWIVATA